MDPLPVKCQAPPDVAVWKLVLPLRVLKWRDQPMIGVTLGLLFRLGLPWDIRSIL